MTLRLVHGIPPAGSWVSPGDHEEGAWVAPSAEARVLPLHPSAMAMAPEPGVLVPLRGFKPRLLHSLHDQEPA